MLEQFLSHIQSEISKLSYGEKPKELYKPITYLMNLGGKRLRPALTLMSYNLFKDDWKSATKPALAIEVFHNFTLMHDDIMDEAPLRRGKPTVHEKWNRDVAILSGDVMLVASYELLSEVPNSQMKTILRRFNQTAKEVCEGQQLDMNFATRNNVTEAEYIEMIRLKTSVLLGFALELGGLVANQSEEVCSQLFDIGVNLGIGFQLKDDMLDVYADPKKFGKQVGGDIIENKKTWLLIKALKRSKGKTEEAELKDWLKKEVFNSDKKVSAVTKIYDSLGIHELAEAEMNAYFKKGFDGIEAFSVAEEKKATLKAFGEYLLGRDR